MENRRSIICGSNSGDAQVTLEVCAGDPRYRIMRFTFSESLRDCLFINKKNGGTAMSIARWNNYSNGLFVFFTKERKRFMQIFRQRRVRRLASFMLTKRLRSYL